MSIQKRLIYMLLGGVLALSLFVGGFAVFAQSGDGSESDETTIPEVEPEAGTAENSDTESGSAESTVPGFRHFEYRFEGSGDNQLLADALGISVEELQAAYETATAAVIQQAVDEGLLTEEEAEALSSGTLGFHKGLNFHFGDIDFDTYLADALGISVEELQDARSEVHAVRLAEMVEAGVITQEQADLITARMAVQEYVDQEAISDALQSAYEAAVNDALEAGAITQEQADLMIENMPEFDGFGLGLGGGFGSFEGPGPHSFGGPGGRHGFHGGPAGGFSAPAFNSSSAETSGA